MHINITSTNNTLKNTQISTLTFNINNESEQIECTLDLPNFSLNTSANNKQIKGIALVLHPHPLFGGTMDNKVVKTMVRSLTDLNYAALRFNFRGVGNSTGVHDNGIGETQDALFVLKYFIQHIYTDMQEQGYIFYEQENYPIILGGFSFGSFIAANLFHELQKYNLQARVQKMIMIGTAAGKWNIPSVPNNSIVIHGDEDEVIPLADTMSWAKKYDLPLTVIPNCGHFFHGKLIELKELIKKNI